jgi:zinc transporter ZupT
VLQSPAAVGGVVFALSLGAGAVPLAARFGPRVLHAVVAAACGLFLGITFLDLLPELAQRSSSPSMWGFVLAGLLAVFFAEVLLRAEEDEHVEHGATAIASDHPAHHGGHRVVGIATFVGLCVHTLGGATVMGLAFHDDAIRRAFVMATLAHKSAEAFSLASVLLLAGLSRRAIALMLVGYASVTPIGLALGRAIAGRIADDFLPPAEGLACGTFLYVAVAELLPEVFHGRSDRALKVVLLLSGIAASTALLVKSGVHA